MHLFDLVLCAFSPFVSNTVGRDNYKYFVGLLMVHPVAYLCFLITTVYFWRRSVYFSAWYILFLLYSFVMFLMVLGLLNYHLKLVTSNLTTNEDINMSRYQYMRNEFNVLSNPFDRGSPWANLLDGLFPATTSFYCREDVVSSLRNGDSGRKTVDYRGSNSGGGSNEDQEGFFEEAKVSLLSGGGANR